MTALYTVLHLLVDGVCALAMFGRFLPREEGYFHILWYNFCAFALQMPFGLLLDRMSERMAEGNKGQRGPTGQPDPAFLTAAAGVVCTIVGALVHPVLLGIGNALFHVGGGVGTILEDRAKNRLGRELGVFVAPGALGLYLGTLIAKAGFWRRWYPWVSLVMVLLCLGAYLRKHGRATAGISKEEEGKPAAIGISGEEEGRSAVVGISGEEEDRSAAVSISEEEEGKPVAAGISEAENVRVEAEELCRQAFDNAQECRGAGRQSGVTVADAMGPAICCLAVVILRSYIGMAVSFPWKTGILAGTLTVFALVGGKVAGGFSSARYGPLKTTVGSLTLAAIGYLFSSFMPAGLAAVFLFNMTMPVTLYWMIESMPKLPGFAFGCLTFGLFLGFLPGYFGLLPGMGSQAGNLVGCAGSVLSLLLLALGMRRRK